ncbi:MAG: hypothetical protein JHC56_09770, partial [Gemmataceae bacterium]|nr:hypothetical protein [Gemmataceae bacterium]
EGPFSRREEGWELGEERKRKKKETHPAQWDGLEGIDKRVGSRGKKKKNAGVKARGKRVGSRGRKRKKCLM